MDSGEEWEDGTFRAARLEGDQRRDSGETPCRCPPQEVETLTGSGKRVSQTGSGKRVSQTGSVVVTCGRRSRCQIRLKLQRLCVQDEDTKDDPTESWNTEHNDEDTNCAVFKCDDELEVLTVQVEQGEVQEKRDSEDKLHHYAKCGKTFTKLEAWEDHQQTHTGTKHYGCPYCDKEFCNSSDMRRHEQAQPEEGALSMKAQRHSQVPPGKNSELHACEEEEEPRFDSVSHFLSEVEGCGRKQHHGARKPHPSSRKPHPCLECGKEFVNQNKLKRHQMTHSGEKPHRCSVCGGGLEETRDEAPGGETVRLLRVWQTLHRSAAPEGSRAHAYWGETVWLHRLWKEVLHLVLPQGSQGHPHRGEPVLLLCVREGLCHVLRPQGPREIACRGETVPLRGVREELLSPGATGETPEETQGWR
ncbi:zinc finger protein 572-like isoform X2 [Hypomesus transpacificus]|uniref:zinc finger protein 572-like isoform X2 n=1 Tax=Hypomesus transpacificus TaxID=137520 RepID=UPI001F0865D3|nr:zinc finger protein 572-like isoform X2 [Hypomesus transpacificus]